MDKKLFRSLILLITYAVVLVAVIVKLDAVGGWLGGVLAAALAVWVAGWMPWLLSMAAGAMITVTAQEMIPDAAEEGAAGVISIVLGFALMMALDVALG